MEVLGDLSIFSCINSARIVQISSRICHKSVQTSYSGGAMLNGGSVASTILSMLEDVPLLCPIIKDLTMDFW